MAFSRKWHNRSGTKTYFAWRSMRQRCYNSSDAAYANYGGRGIRVCDSWIDNYDAFVSDMGEAPPNMSLDRIDNDKGYSKDNCRWATVSDQLNNQRRSKLLVIDGRCQTQAEWAAEKGLSQDTVAKRLKRMSAELALTPGRLCDAVPWEHGTRKGYEVKGCRCDECRKYNTDRAREYRKRFVIGHRGEDEANADKSSKESAGTQA